MNLLTRLRRHHAAMHPKDRAHQAYLQYLGAPDDDGALLDLATAPDDDTDTYDSDDLDEDHNDD